MCVDIIEKALNQVQEKPNAPVTNPRVASVFRANTLDTEKKSPPLHCHLKPKICSDVRIPI